MYVVDGLPLPLSWSRLLPYAFKLSSPACGTGGTNLTQHQTEFAQDTQITIRVRVGMAFGLARLSTWLTLSHLTFRRLHVAQVKFIVCSLSLGGVGLPFSAGAMGTGCTLGAAPGGATLILYASKCFGYVSERDQGVAVEEKRRRRAIDRQTCG